MSGLESSRKDPSLSHLAGACVMKDATHQPEERETFALCRLYKGSQGEHVE
jgi:hypothetical protein